MNRGINPDYINFVPIDKDWRVMWVTYCDNPVGVIVRHGYFDGAKDTWTLYPFMPDQKATNNDLGHDDLEKIGTELITKYLETGELPAGNYQEEEDEE